MNTPLSRQMDQMADAQEWKERAEAAEATLAEAQHQEARAIEALGRLVDELAEARTPDEYAAGLAVTAENIALKAEVERLRGLPDEISAEAHAVPVGETFHGGGLHGAPRFDVMMWAVSRIRAALRGGGE